MTATSAHLDAYPPARAEIDPDISLGWIRRFLPVMGSHRRLVLTGIGTALAGQLTMMVFPIIVQRTIDESLLSRTTPLADNVRVLVLIVVAALVAGVVSRLLMMRVAAYVQYDLRTILQSHLGRQSFSYHDRSDTGQLISRANSDIRAIEMFLVFTPMVSMMFVGLVVALVVMLRTDVLLALVTLASLPLVYWLGLRMRRLSFPLSWLVQARTADVATIVEENVAGAHVVRAMAAEQDQIADLEVAADALHWASLQEVSVRARYQPLLEAVPLVGQAVFILLAGLAAIDGRISIGDLVLFTSYFAMMQWPFRVLGFFVMMAQRSRAAAGRVFEIIDRAPEVQDRPDAVELLDAQGRISFEHVEFAFADGSPVLRDLNLTLEAGDKVALVGRTASGKSTIANLIPRFYDVDAGRVTIDGIDVRDITQTSLRSHIGLVMDEAFLFTTSIRDNIAFARPDTDFETVRRAAESAGALDFIEALPQQWDTVVGERGYTLSGGQRQRIAIARVLVQNPAVLILDDATSAIDVQVERQIHDALEHLLEDRTTLLIAHRPATIALADRVALVADGMIVAEGTHARLLQDEPRYGEVLAVLDEDDALDRRRRQDEPTPHRSRFTDGDDSFDAAFQTPL